MGNLGKCPTCKKEISINANKCPHCGEYNFVIKKDEEVIRDCYSCKGAGCKTIWYDRLTDMSKEYLNQDSRTCFSVFSHDERIKWVQNNCWEECHDCNGTGQYKIINRYKVDLRNGSRKHLDTFRNSNGLTKVRILTISVYSLKDIKKKEEEINQELKRQGGLKYCESCPSTNHCLRYKEQKEGCFITTAVFDSISKNDNCYQLNIFRQFRDDWILEQSNGKELIEQYYRISPSIVNAIEQNTNKTKIYQDIWNIFLYPCLELIEKKQYDNALEKYIEMVHFLKKADSTHNRIPLTNILASKPVSSIKAS